VTVATRWPFVGRRDEVAAFGLALDDPGCEAFCIYGAAGVGKTRLGDECSTVAEARGRRVLRAAPDPSTADVPLAAGQSSRAIAERLVLSVRTVENHLARIYTKLGVSGRVGLAAALDSDGRATSGGAG
jgi:hypothetical protein